ncbi:MAG: hypothetical protein ACYC3O_13245 [Burkholderiales bacterium]
MQGIIPDFYGKIILLPHFLSGILPFYAASLMPAGGKGKEASFEY